MNNNSDKENPKRDAFSFFWSFKDAIMGLEDENLSLIHISEPTRH